MSGRQGGRGKVLLPPINFIFKLLQQHSTVSIWLYEQLAIRIEGKIRVCSCQQLCDPDSLRYFKGFDEFMNLVIDDAVEVQLATKNDAEERRQLGKLSWVVRIWQSLIDYRTNTAERRQCFFDTTITIKIGFISRMEL